MAEMKLAELAALVGGELEGDGTREIRGVAAIDQAGPADLTFLANPRYERHMATTQAGAVVVSPKYAGPAPVPLIRAGDPYFAFRQAVVKLYGFRKKPFMGVHRRSYVDQRAELGENVVVAAFATICEGAVIGDNTVLYPGVFIGPHTRVGRDCVLHPNVVVYERCVLGDRVTVHANTVIGEDGFGYATHNGVHHKIPHVGHVEIENDVEIGANCAIDRAAVGVTRVGLGSKFSNLIAIGHGSSVGRHNLLVAQVGLAGSVTAGDYCVFAGQAGVAGHLTIGDRVRVGAQAGVHQAVPSDTEVLGSPAQPLAQARRSLIAGMQLPELRNQVRQMARELDKLKALARQAGLDLDEGGDADVSA